MANSRHPGAALPVGSALRAHDSGLGGVRLRQHPQRRRDTDGINYGTARILRDEIGTRAQDDITLLDLRAEKFFGMGSGRRLGAFFDVYNLTNAAAQQNITWNSGVAFERPA